MKKLMIILYFLYNQAYADKTNINKITTEFADHNANIVPNKNSDDSIINEVLNPTSDNDLVNLNDPEAKGLSKRQEQPFFNFLEVDYTKPGAKAHKQEIDSIISRIISKLSDLSAVLLKNGIDCQPSSQQTNSNSFNIDSDDIPIKEVEYNQIFCEQLQNKYNCRKYLNLHCLKKSILWSDWQNTQIKVSANELKSSAPNALFADHVASKIFELKLFKPGDHPYFNSVPAIKLYLAKKHNSTIGHISGSMTFTWEGGVTHLGGKDYQWNTYIINYKYRNGEEICDKWSDETWQENCSFG